MKKNKIEFFIFSVLFLLSFFTTSFFVKTRYDYVDYTLSQKLNDLALKKDKVTTLVLGTSHVHNGIKPSILDATLQKNDVHSYTYNLALGSMLVHEVQYILDYIKKHNFPQLKYVLIEHDLNRMNPIFHLTEPSRYLSVRSIYWHTPKNWLYLVNYYLRTIPQELFILKKGLLERTNDKVAIQPEKGKAEKKNPKSDYFTSFTHNIWKGLYEVYHNTVAALYYVTNRGLLDYYFQQNKGDPYDTSDNGYEPLIRVLNEEARADFQSRLTILKERDPKKRHDPGQYLRIEWERITKAVRSLKATPILVDGPFTSQFVRPDWVQSAGFAGYLDFGDPIHHPELYNVDLWADGAHLNDKGAEVFSAHLANEMAKYILQLQGKKESVAKNDFH